MFVLSGIPIAFVHCQSALDASPYIVVHVKPWEFPSHSAQVCNDMPSKIAFRTFPPLHLYPSRRLAVARIMLPQDCLGYHVVACTSRPREGRVARQVSMQSRADCTASPPMPNTVAPFTTHPSSLAGSKPYPHWSIPYRRGARRSERSHTNVDCFFVASSPLRF